MTRKEAIRQTEQEHPPMSDAPSPADYLAAVFLVIFVLELWILL